MKKKLEIKCSCGCGTKLFVGDFGDEQVAIDIRDPNDKKWRGVVVDTPKIKRFLKQLV